MAISERALGAMPVGSTPSSRDSVCLPMGARSLRYQFRIQIKRGL